MSHQFNPKHMEKLDNPKRRELLPPELVLQELALEPGWVIADVGCGSGYFSVPAAIQVGSEGSVVGFDISPEMLAAFNERAATAGVTNTKGVLTSGSSLDLVSETANVTLLCTVLHEVPEPLEMLQEIYRILKPGGILAIVEWHRDESDWGPPESHRLSSETVAGWLQETGYQTAGAKDLNGYHYLMVGKK